MFYFLDAFKSNSPISTELYVRTLTVTMILFPDIRITNVLHF